ncbi:uncharacterized protein SCODWIG_00642 [Saccharomycodes ludwigii]|uniref:PA14 domain-containing protein n=1 Tax=Saccharomycodes ludwigii TaxID=36035 RepID=A0A376B2K9_9ASCO|nr:uncharacterized protein SCODWIG_00642 [Saccharomycodes ludwigii]
MLTAIYKHCVLTLFICLLQLSKAINAVTDSDTEDACNPLTNATPGFKVRWYNYTLGDTNSFTSLDYMAYEYYQQSTAYHSMDGVETVEFESGFPCQYDENNSDDYFICYCDGYSTNNGNWVCPCSGSKSTSSKTCYNSQADSVTLPLIYDYDTTFTNFTMEITGYFLAPETGPYNFTLGNVDDSAGLLFGKNAFGCCEQNDITAATTDFFINAIKGWHSGQDATTSSLINLVGGFYYPLRLVFSNAISYASLDFTVTLPNETIITDFENYVFTFDEEESYCPAYSTTTVPWTGTYTSTFTTKVTTATGSNGLTTTSNVIYVETPGIETNSTIITGWTGTYDGLDHTHLPILQVYSPQLVMMEIQLHLPLSTSKHQMLIDRKSTRLNSSH